METMIFICVFFIFLCVNSDKIIVVKQDNEKRLLLELWSRGHQELVQYFSQESNYALTTLQKRADMKLN
jgi:hypothetical protein